MGKVLCLDQYQELAHKYSLETAIEDDKLVYPVLGLVGEAGEVAGKVKKHYRDGGPLDCLAITKELGDVLWYLAEIASVLNVSLSDIATLNIRKLQCRQERDKLQGNGDDR